MFFFKRQERFYCHAFKAETHYENTLEPDTLPVLEVSNSDKSERLTKYTAPPGIWIPSMTKSSSTSRDVPGAVGYILRVSFSTWEEVTVFNN